MTSVTEARRQQQQQSDTVANSNTAAGAPDATGKDVAAAGTGAGGCGGAAAAERLESQQPLYPPTPMIGHLTNEEIDALNDVFSRMEMFEAEESARIRSAAIPYRLPQPADHPFSRHHAHRRARKLQNSLRRCNPSR